MTTIRPILGIKVLFASVALAAPPSNDDFSSATVVGPSLPATLVGDAKDATYQADEPVLNSESWNGSIWFKWVPGSAGTGFAVPAFTWEIAGPSTPGSGYEMLVHRGTSLSGLTTIARGDEFAPLQRFAFEIGQTYYIQVFVQTDSLFASFPCKLVVSSTTGPATPPVNDAFGAATLITSGVPKLATGTTVGATIESGESIDAQFTRSVWYQYTSDTDDSRLFRLLPSGDDSLPKAEIFTGTSLTNLSRVGWINSFGETSIPLVNGTQYYIRVFNEEADSYSVPGAFVLQINPSPPGLVPDNDAFSNASNLSSALPATTTGNTFKSGIEAGEKLPMGTNGTVWFKWTAPSAGWYSALATSLDDPPGISVWTGSTLADLKLKGASDSFSGLTNFMASEGETVYIQACGEGGYFFPFGLEVTAAIDPELPRVVSTALSNPTVDVTSGAQTITVTLEIAGPAHGYISYVDFLHPGGGLADFASTADLIQTSGTPGNGIFTTSLTIPQGAAPGSYPLVVYMRDGSESSDYLFGSTGLITDRSPLYFLWTTYADIPSGPDFLTVTNSGAANSPPALTSFAVSPANADVGAAPASFTFTAVVTDAEGVNSVSVDWNDPSGILPGGSLDLVRDSGTAVNGTWSATLEIPQYADPGRIELTLAVTDSIGQARQFGIQPNNIGLRESYYGRLQTMSGSFITLNNSAGLDKVPPQISEVTITPNPARFGSGGTVDLTISVRAKDAQAGTDEVYFTLGSNPLFLLPRLSGSPADGIYGATITVRRANSGPGVYSAFFATYDLINQEGIITSAVPGVSETTLLAPEPGTYDAWAFDFGLVPPLDVPSASAQADGISNALKFAFNLDPTQSVTGAARFLTPTTGLSGLPSIVRVGSGATASLRVEYLRRIAPGLRYAAEFSSTLEEANSWTLGGVETVTAIDALWERVVVEDSPGAGSPVRFGRVKVTSNP